MKYEINPKLDAVFSKRKKWCMIVKNGWKLAARREDEGLVPNVMTHLDEDPYKMINRVEDPEVAELRQAMLAELREWDAGVRRVV